MSFYVRDGSWSGYNIMPNGDVQLLGPPDGQTPWIRLRVGDHLGIAGTDYVIAAINDGSAASGAGATLHLTLPQHTVRMTSGDVFTVLAVANMCYGSNASTERAAHDVSSRFDMP